jgi:DNA processing protein
MAPDPLIDFVALSLLPVWRWRDASERLKTGMAPGRALEALLDGRPRDPARTPDVLRAKARDAVARSTTTGQELIVWSDERYPPMLAAIPDPPPVLWVRGQTGALTAPAVAIVGSRAGSPYALAVAERLAGDLAARAVLVVSGLARGVDSAAHRGALSAGGRTVGVLGCGADLVYPREHADLAAEMGREGAVVSELVPGTPPTPAFFPRRNRVISGLVRAVVVVEAGERSGSLITARCALEQGREVLAVPGNVLSGRNRGGHALLKDGAKIVESADDILEELGIGTAPAVFSVEGAQRSPQASGRATDPLLECFPPGETCDLDVLAERSGLPTARLLPRLFELEIQGLIRRAGGGRFVRFDSSC